MQKESNVPAERAPRRVERRLIEDIWKLERNLLVPLMPRRDAVPVIADDATKAANQEESLSRDLADLLAEEALDEVEMGDIGQETALGPSKQRFIAIVVVLMVIVSVMTYLMTFIDARSLPGEIIKRLY